MGDLHLANKYIWLWQVKLKLYLDLLEGQSQDLPACLGISQN